MTRAGFIPLSAIERIQIYTRPTPNTMAGLSRILDETGGDIVMNAAIFLRTLKPCCHLKADGLLLCAPNYAAWSIMWTQPEDFRVAVAPSDAENYMECVHVIIDGKKITPIRCGSDMRYACNRTLIGTKPGHFGYIVTQDNYTPEGAQTLAANMGFESAILMDGGGSSCIRFANGEGFAGDGRTIPFYLVVHLKEKEEGKPVKKVCLDAGHDASNLANKSPDSTYYEHEFALDMAKRIKAHLVGAGVDVIETRPDGRAVSLGERCRISNASGADLFVSLHTNAAGSGWSDPRGLEVYVYDKGGKAHKAAQAIVERMDSAGVVLRKYPVGAKPDLYVLRHTTAPAVLIEHGFHTSRADVSLLRQPGYRRMLAAADAQGILDYLGIDHPAPAPAEPTEKEQAIAWAIGEGILKGDSSGSLMLGEPLTTERWIVMLYRYHNLYRE